MSTLLSLPSNRESLENLKGELMSRLHHSAIPTMIIGALLMIAGAFALANVLQASVISVLLLSWLLVLGGIFHFVNAFSARAWQSALLDVFVGLAYFIAGLMAFRQPIAAANALALVIAFAFLFTGIARVFGALTLRPLQWGWILANGVISAFLGGLLLSQWPATTVWLPGTVLAVDLLLSGWSMACVGAVVYRGTREAPSTAQPAAT
jgi:uncharacterized membrane protein HdeD (DUF308 family)